MAALAASDRAAAGRARLPQRVSTIATYGFLVTFCVLILAPFMWAMLTSVKILPEVLHWPPVLIPSTLTFEHYVSVFTVKGIPTYFLNTIIVATATIALTFFVACPLAYVTARFQFGMRQALLFLILGTAMVPSISILLPLYLSAYRLSLIDTYVVQILIYSAAMTPQVTWVLRGFFLNIPPDIEEAARIDGCSRLTAFCYVVLPLARPGLAAAGILIFVYVWNDYLINVIMTSSDYMRTIQVGLSKLITDVGVHWGEYMAYLVSITVPPVVAFFFLQRRFLQSLISGAVKG